MTLNVMPMLWMAKGKGPLPLGRPDTQVKSIHTYNFSILQMARSIPSVAISWSNASRWGQPKTQRYNLEKGTNVPPTGQDQNSVRYRVKRTIELSLGLGSLDCAPHSVIFALCPTLGACSYASSLPNKLKIVIPSRKIND